MLDLVKYKQTPYEIEDSVLSVLPMKDTLELTHYINDTFTEVMGVMKIHKANLDKIKAIMADITRTK